MLRCPPPYVWPIVLALLCVLEAAPARAQRSQPLKPGQTSRAPYQSPAARVPPRVPYSPPTPMPRGDTVPLPFNLAWGDTQPRLASLFAGVGSKITEKKATNQGETWTVQGLIAPGLQASLFTFQQGMLTGVEFDYGQPDWDTAKYNEVMGQLRRRLEGLCGGAGEMVRRESGKDTDSGIRQTLMGYQWNRGDTLVQLFYFSAEETAKSLTYRTISVHYHYQNPQGEPAPEGTNAPLMDTPASTPPDPNAEPSVVVPSGQGPGAQPTPTPPVSPKSKKDDDALPE
jgi:hypothetical protein